MWFKFAAIAALVFHRGQAIDVAQRHRAVDYWLRGSGLRMLNNRPLPINKEWKTESGQAGDALLRNVAAATAPSASARPPMPGPPEDYTVLRHKADGLAADHPANREYK